MTEVEMRRYREWIEHQIRDYDSVREGWVAEARDAFYQYQFRNKTDGATPLNHADMIDANTAKLISREEYFNLAHHFIQGYLMAKASIFNKPNTEED